MSGRLIWDEAKRQANLTKHGLDFEDAAWVLESRYRLDVLMARHGELRTASFSYVMDRLAVLVLVHVPREDAVRIVSFRYATKRSRRNTMSGSKKTPRPTRKAILKGMKTPPPGGYFVWHGKDQNDRPVTAAEMDAGIAAYRAKRGRPAGSKKVSTTIRFDTDVVEKFRARGRGWQSQMNAALREWLQAHE